MTTRGRAADRAALIGLGPTAIMYLGGEAIRRATGVPPLDYGLVGRWIGHMPRRQFTHDSIHAAAPVPGEKKLGLVAHYSIGIALAGLLQAARPGWAQRPTLAPAIATGLGSTAAPFVLMQPASGWASRRQRRPTPPSPGCAACVPTRSTGWACTSPPGHSRDSAAPADERSAGAWVGAASRDRGRGGPRPRGPRGNRDRPAVHGLRQGREHAPRPRRDLRRPPERLGRFTSAYVRDALRAVEEECGPARRAGGEGSPGPVAGSTGVLAADIDYLAETLRTIQVAAYQRDTKRPWPVGREHRGL